jgi:hypothetical protein
MDRDWQVGCRQRNCINQGWIKITSRKAAKVSIDFFASLRDYLTILPIYFKALIQKVQVTIKKPQWERLPLRGVRPTGWRQPRN